MLLSILLKEESVTFYVTVKFQLEYLIRFHHKKTMDDTQKS